VTLTRTERSTASVEMRPNDQTISRLKMLMLVAGVLGGGLAWTHRADEFFMFGVSGLELPARAVSLVTGSPMVVTIRLSEFPIDQYTRTPVTSGQRAAVASSAMAGAAGASASVTPTMKAFHQPYDVAFWVARSENESYGWLECQTPSVFGVQLATGGAVIEVGCVGPNIHEVESGSLLTDWVVDTTGMSAKPVIIPFEQNTDVISPGTAASLDAIVADLRRAAQVEVMISGVADSGERNAVALAQRRIEVVRRALTAGQIADERLISVNYGSTTTPMVEQIAPGMAKRLVVISRLARTRTPS
jgi:outer membrane protein OmpA-like peptidoglycan-associated protein